MQLTELGLDRNLNKAIQTVETQGSDYLAGNVSPEPSNLVASGNTVYDINTNAMTINGSQLTPGTVPQTTLDIANWGWTQTCAFSVTNATKVSWTGSGTFKSADGTHNYTISAGDTGTMTAGVKKYIYLDIAVSTTAYQQATNILDPIGVGKVLIAVCETDGTKATYSLVQATQIIADNILVNSLSAMSANMGSITAGTITMNTSGYIKGGQSDYDNGTGFFLGYSGGAYKFSLGNSGGAKMNWTGTDFSVSGATITGGILQTSAATNVDRIIIDGTANEIQFWNSDNSISAYLFTQYSPISGMSGVQMEGGGGTFLGLGGKSNEGFSSLGVMPSVDDSGYIQVTWDGNDPTSSRLELVQSYSSGVRTLPIGSNLIPYGTKELGSSSSPWNSIYVNNFIPTQSIIPDGTVNLGSSSSGFQSLYLTDGLYFSSTRYIEFLSAEINMAKPVRLKSLSSTPGSAASYTGCVYYDTTKTTLVFSDGTGWFKVVANSY